MLRPQTACGRCGQLNPADQRCPCKPAHQRDRRPNSTARGYGYEHETVFRPGVLRRDQICVLCHVAIATRADHWPRDRKELVALGLNPNDPQYGRGLCDTCDSRQTAQRQPGGWNRRG